MGQQKIGHFGLAAPVVAGLAVLALVLHLAVPYAHVEFKDAGGATVSEETFSRSDIADDFEELGDRGPNASPGLTLAGVIVALVGAAALAVLGFVPLRVDAARWAGWGSGVVASVGAAMAFVSSMWWVGSGFGLQTSVPQFAGFDGGFGMTGPFGPMQQGFQEGFQFVMTAFGLTGGFTGFLEWTWGTDSGTEVWVISPALVAGLSLAILVLALRVCGNVASPENQVRERSRRHLRSSLFAMVFAGLVLLVPWSIGEMPDAGGENEDYFAYGARTILVTEDLTGGELFDHMAYALNVMVVAAWIGFAMGVVGSLGGVLASVGVPGAAARWFHLATVPTAFMFLWSALLYLLAWIYMWKPFEEAEGWQPGYFPVVLLAVFALWGINQFNLLATGYRSVRGAGGASVSAPAAVSFD